MVLEPKRTLEGKCQICGRKTLDVGGEVTNTTWVLTKIENGYCADEINGEWCNSCFRAIVRAK